MTEFQGFFDQIKQQDAARTATQLRLNPLQPDQAAEGLGVARELGLPAGQVMAFPELFKDKLAAQKATTALTKAPKLSDWLRSDPVHGALAKDDIENLSWFEQGFNDFRAMGGAMIDSQVGRGLQTGAKGAQQMAVGAATLPIAGMQATMLERIDAYERAAQLDPATPRHEIAAALGIDPMSPTAGLVADFVAGDADRRAWHIERAAKVITSNEETMATLTGKIREYEEEMKATQGRVPNFTDIDDIKGFGDWLGFNLGQAAPYLLATATAGAVGGPAGMLGVGYGMGVGDIRSEQITSGQDPFDQRAAAAAAVGGVPYAGIELLGAAARPFRNVGGEVLEQVAEAWAKRVGKETGLSAVEEFINEAGQEIIKDFSVWAGGGEAVELNNETLLKWFNSGMAGLATGATVGGGRTALTIAAEKDVERAAQAGSAARLLDQVSQGAAATKLKERAPDQFKAALDQAGRGDDLVYLPAQGLREFFQAKDVDFSAEVAEMWGIDLNTMAQMELSGGRVGVPISNFAAYVAGTDAEAWVRENATLDPDEVSLADAAAFNDQVQDQLTAAYEQEAAEARADLERRSSDQQVFDGVYSQLREAGRTADVAEKEARVFGAFFRTMADRVGDDALDLARRFGLRIQGPDAPGLPRRRGQLDVMLNDLRSGRKEKTGRSLVQFIIDEGGVQDTGGDVAALEGPKGLVAETREEILARQSQPSLDGMPSTGRGLQLDELGRKAVELGYFPELMGEVAGLNDGEAADLGRAVLEALGEEMSGRPRYLEGEGPDPARAALNDALQERGIDPAAMTNDEIAAALETVQEGEFAQSAPVESEAFRAWFGDSKVVDAEGKPLVVYHGAPDVRDILASGFKKSPTRGGVYFTSDKQSVANTYADDSRALDYQNAEPHVIPLYMSLQNPLVIDAKGQKWRETEKHIQEARDGGHDGLIIKNSRDEYNNTKDGGAISTVYVAFEPTQMKSAMTQNLRSRVDRIDIGGGPNRGTFDPADPRILYQEKRGSIQLPRGGIASGETIINLFENADLSTVIHEAGHFFLEAMNDLASQPGAPQQLRDDMDAVRKFIGAEEGKAIETEAHETFARALEAYFLEGKAPSLALGDVFARAKAWLLRIYRGISGLNVKMNAEIREVFDRMLATDAEIDAARAEASADPLFREKPAGMSDADWATYQRMARRSAQDAEDRLREKVMEKVRREKQAWWKAERKALRAEVEARMNTEPRFRLVEAMANGRILTPEGERAAPDVRIDRATLVEQFGDGVLAEVSRTRLGGKRAIYGEDGMTPAEAAEMFGFPGASEMVSQLQNTGKRQDEIAAEVDRIMLDRYGDVLHDGTIEAAALDAIHNAHMEQKNVTEARQIAKQLGRDTRSMTPALYKQRARLMLGRMTVREASAPARFLAAERKAGRDAERAFAKVARGDAGALALALQAKEQQILNAALFDLSRQVEKDVSRAREKAQDYGKKSIRQKLEGGYIEQIDDLLDRYDFRKRGPGAVQKSERLREFMDRMIADGREAELMIDPRMMDDARRVHYSRLSLDEFRGLMDTIANLDHLGRLKQSLINGRKQRDLQITAEAVADAVAKNLGTGRAKQESKLRYALDLVFTADTMMIDIDGGDEFGTSYQAIKEDIDQAYVRVDEMNRELAEKLDGLFSVYSAKDMREMKKERAIPGTRFVWSKWQAISVALNTGNDANMSRLLAEDAHPTQRMTREDLDAVLATLDKRDWDFVQSMWDQINSYWPQIEAVTQRRTGVKPAKVEARQVLTPFGAYPGGYYPIKYDPGLGARAAVDAKTETDNFMSAGRFAKAQTKSGHTKERLANGNGRTVMLDMSVAFSHMRDVVRDIALSEAVDNAHRVLNHNEVTQSFIEAGRKNDHDVLNLWLKDVAQGPIVHTDPINTFARFIKTNFTLSRLALNLKTVLLQVTGVAQSAVVVGRKPMAHAFADYLKRPQETVAEVMAASEFMRRRQTTFDKDIQDFATDTLDTSPMRGRMAKALDGAARFGFAPMIKTQFYAVDVPTWVAGYRAGLKRFDGDAERAVSFADRMVARAQDSGAMPDRTAVSRGTLSENVRQVEFVRLFTTLQGYMLAKFNRGYVETRRGLREVRAAETRAQQFGAAADMAANLMMLYVAEGAMMGLLYAAMAAGDDEDDEITREKFALWLAGETFGTVIGGFPLARDAWTGFSEFGDTGGVLGSALAIPSEIYKQVVQGENDRGLRRAVGDAVGMATGLPTVATLRPIEELLDEDGGSIMGALLGFNPLTN